MSYRSFAIDNDNIAWLRHVYGFMEKQIVIRRNLNRQGRSGQSDSVERANDCVDACDPAHVILEVGDRYVRKLFNQRLRQSFDLRVNAASYIRHVGTLLFDFNQLNSG